MKISELKLKDTGKKIKIIKASNSYLNGMTGIIEFNVEMQVVINNNGNKIMAIFKNDEVEFI